MPRIAQPTRQAVAHAASILRAGGVVAFPTETVYGLGALTLNPAGLDLVYELKGRPANNPLIAHVLDVGQAQTIIAPGAWDQRCEALARTFWPGPLALILPKRADVPARATGGLPTIAVRAPAHPVARALIEAVGEPISAPSANRSGRVSPTQASHVFDEFRTIEAPAARELLILDGGSCDVGIESTVLDLTGDLPRVLRPGRITAAQLRNVIGEVESAETTRQASSPGTSASHYAPRTPVQLVDSGVLRSILQAHSIAGRRCAVLCFPGDFEGETPHTLITVSRAPAEYAHDLYALLRHADALRCDHIVIENPPEDDDAWRAVRDRLRRAAAG